ncbi:MAG: alanine--tRNA ligase [Thermoplasmata archaeon]
MPLEEEPLKFFLENGYEKKKCPKCGAYFWTIDKDRITCGEAPCDPYSFILNPPTERKYSLEEMREEFLSFFEREGHKRIKRYPIVARWREDVYLVNASIYDFQPHVTSGKVPPPGNPLVISQPCIRTVDLDNVGKTGRHLSVFEMGGAKSFNFPGKEIYWKDKAVEYSRKFLEHLGVNPIEITYKEKPWSGGGNAGSAVEVMVRGLEVATLVFMDMVEDPNGEYEIDGIRYKKMDNRIVDTGYGIDRFTWLSQGTETIFETLYPEMVKSLMNEVGITTPEFLKEFINKSTMEDGSEIKFLQQLPADEREKMEKLSLIYMLSDHSRALTFLLFDGLVPSNSKAGYVLRMMIRRSLLAIQKLKMKTTLWNLIEIQEERFKDILDTRLEKSAREIVELETDRFNELLMKGDSLIKKYSKNGSISEENVLLLFQSNGLPIEYIRERCQALSIRLPESINKVKGFNNVRKDNENKKQSITGTYPPTRKLYYENEKNFEFKSKVISLEGNGVILEETAFYPEGGGQPSDRGYLVINGNKYIVDEVKIMNNVIVHYLNSTSGIKKGDAVLGLIDKDRRERLMKNHSATHVLLSSIRSILGPHVWQSGAQKDPAVSRLDITHYKDISAEELKEIENRANEVIRMDIPLHKEFVERNKAEEKYGFILYQGGIPDGNQLRLVEIPGIDAEGCGGTHVDRTGEIGFIKIIRVEKIQDGVMRFHFTAGKSALEIVQRMDDELRIIKETMGNDPLSVYNSIKKELNEVRKAISGGTEEHLISYKGNDIRIIETDEVIADEISKSIKTGVAIIKSDERLRIASLNKSISAIELLKVLENKGIVKGGGNSEFAQGKVLKQNLQWKEIEEGIKYN